MAFQTPRFYCPRACDCLFSCFHYLSLKFLSFFPSNLFTFQLFVGYFLEPMADLLPNSLITYSTFRGIGGLCTGVEPSQPLALWPPPTPLVLGL